MRKARIYPSGELLCLNKTIVTVHEGQDPIFLTIGHLLLLKSSMVEESQVSLQQQVQQNLLLSIWTLRYVGKVTLRYSNNRLRTIFIIFCNLNQRRRLLLLLHLVKMILLIRLDFQSGEPAGKNFLSCLPLPCLDGSISFLGKTRNEITPYCVVLFSMKLYVGIIIDKKQKWWIGQ